MKPGKLEFAFCAYTIMSQWLLGHWIESTSFIQLSLVGGFLVLGGCLFVYNFLEMFDADASRNSIPLQKGALNLRNICGHLMINY